VSAQTYIRNVGDNYFYETKKLYLISLLNFSCRVIWFLRLDENLYILMLIHIFTQCIVQERILLAKVLDCGMLRIYDYICTYLGFPLHITLSKNIQSFISYHCITDLYKEYLHLKTSKLNVAQI
jgi:hypothetical protein